MGGDAIWGVSIGVALAYYAIVFLMAAVLKSMSYPAAPITHGWRLSLMKSYGLFASLAGSVLAIYGQGAVPGVTSLDVIQAAIGIIICISGLAAGILGKRSDDLAAQASLCNIKSSYAGKESLGGWSDGQFVVSKDDMAALEKMPAAFNNVFPLRPDTGSPWCVVLGTEKGRLLCPFTGESHPISCDDLEVDLNAGKLHFRLPNAKKQSFRSHSFERGRNKPSVNFWATVCLLAWQAKSYADFRARAESLPCLTQSKCSALLTWVLKTGHDPTGWMGFSLPCNSRENAADILLQEQGSLDRLVADFSGRHRWDGLDLLKRLIEEPSPHCKRLAQVLAAKLESATRWSRPLTERSTIIAAVLSLCLISVAIGRSLLGDSPSRAGETDPLMVIPAVFGTLLGAGLLVILPISIAANVGIRLQLKDVTIPKSDPDA